DNQTHVLSFGGLTAFDATGKTLPASFSLDGSNFAIDVDIREAVFPITIDPLLQQPRLVAYSQIGVENERFGYAMAMDGDTALVSTYPSTGYGYGRGTVYVMARDNGEWRTQSILRTGIQNDNFGERLALEGDTAVIGASGTSLGADNVGVAYVYTRIGDAWTQQAMLTASDGTLDDYFGTSVGISGNTIAVGAVRDDNEQGTDAGALYIFERSADTWVEQTKILPADDDNAPYFGGLMDISGNTIIVGRPNANIEGAAYLFVGSGANWVQQQKFVDTYDASPAERFGQSVSIDGNNLLIGSPTSNGGRAFFYTLENDTWVEKQYVTKPEENFGWRLVLDDNDALISHITNSDITQPSTTSVHFYEFSNGTWSSTRSYESNITNDAYGTAIALSDNRALVSAPYDDIRQTGTPLYNLLEDVGTLYLYERTSSWQADGTFNARSPQSDTRFGRDIAADDQTVVVGAPYTDVDSPFGPNMGAAHVFVRDGMGGWSLQATLLPNVSHRDQLFGSAVAISGNTILVSAPQDNARDVSAGAVYVYTREGATWTLQAKLTADDGERVDQFGKDVSLVGDTALITASHDDEGGFANAGSAYIFERVDTTWSQTSKFTATTPATNAYFGQDGILNGDTALITMKNPQTRVREVHIFVYDGINWTEQQQLVPSDTSANDTFGLDLGLDGDTAIIGA
ncbi:MAG: hypothetical protein AAFQ07_08495, partial [Chloroflexota bacterium]